MAEKSGPDAARELRALAIDLADAGITEMRRLARGIHPAILTDRGLGPAVEALASRLPLTVAVLETPALTPLALRRYGRRAALAEWRANWPRIVAVGALTQLTYWLVLRAYAIARVGYTGAIREVSIVFAALIGWLWLGERFGAARTAGSLLIVAGILTIAVAG